MKKWFSFVLFFLLIFHNTSFGQITYKEAFPNINFAYPVELQSPDDDTNRMFVVEQAGSIKAFSINENITPQDVTTFLTITNRVFFSEGQELGLLGLAFHPNFKTNGFFYVYYTTESPVSGISTRMVLSRFSVSSSNTSIADPNSELVIFQYDKNQNNSNHNGGKIAFGPDNYLYISFGDGGGGNDPKGNGQNKNTVFGSICRIDVDIDGNNTVSPNGNYEIPSDNPYVGQTGLDEIYAIGIRNTWKFSFDNITNRLWGADVGQGAFEEINIIQNGNNYGWNRYEGTSIANSSTVITEPVTFPVYIYDHNQGDFSITGGYVYRGSEITSLNPEINSKYIYGDFVSGKVWALDYNESTGIANSTLLFKTNGLSVSSFGKDKTGEIYFCSYSTNSKIFKLIDGTESPSGTAVNGFGEWQSLNEGIINGIVQTIANDGNNNIYVGGVFNKVGIIDANNIGIWNLNTGWNSFGSGTNGSVNSIKVDSNNNVYVGGAFTEINGVSANNIAMWNGAIWSQVGSGIDGVVSVIEINANNNVYVGGIFNQINSIVANNIAMWNGFEWSVLKDATNQIAGMNNEVRSLEIDSQGVLYVGGNFDSAGGNSANRIATWDGTNWGALGTGTSGFVEAIATTLTDVYVGGNFTTAGGNTVNRIARWNKSTLSWSSLEGGVSNSVVSLIHNGTNLYVAGSFNLAFNNSSDIIVNNIARWNISDGWQALGTNTNVGVDIKLNTIVFSPDSNEKIFTGGNFSKAGVIDANNIALWKSENVLEINEYYEGDLTFLYPNPTTGNVQLSKIKDWQLINSLGKILKKGIGKSFNISNYASGIYFLKTKNGQVFKIIKQ